MKKYTKFLVVSIVLFLCVIAFSSCNNVDYELTDGTLLYREVEGGYEVTGIADENATEIKIPYFFKLKKVVSIGDGAFYENSNIVSVIIPNSVKEIGYYNFTYCDSLEYIEVPSSVERIRQGCFKYSDYLEFNEYDNGKYLGNERNPYFALVGSKNREITSCKVNEKCKIIAGAFQWCENLETVEIPDGVKVIDEYAFYACEALKEIDIPSSVKIIGDVAFSNCHKLEKVAISSKIEEIGDNVFGCCYLLTDISFPNTLKKLGQFTFESAYKVVFNEYEGGLYFGNEENPYLILVRLKHEKMAELIIHKDTKIIDVYSVFVDREYENRDARITSIVVPENSKHFKVVDGALYTKNGKTLVKYVRDESQFTVPKGVKYIGDYAFAYNKNLASVVLPQSVKELGIGAFENCSSLELVNIPSKITAIQRNTFYMCTSLKNIELPNGLLYIGEQAFIYCSALESIDIPKNVRYIDNYAFSYCDALKRVVIPDNVFEIGRHTFSYCENLEEIVVGKGIRTINFYAFSENPSLKKVVLSNRVKSIGGGAFKNCTALERIEYEGTYAEWIEVDRYTSKQSGDNWDSGTGDYMVSTK